MNKRLLFVLMLVPVFQMAFAQEEIVKWTFPTGAIGDTVQNSTNALNLTSAIHIESAGPITMTNGLVTGDYAATATNWNDGMDIKNWSITFKTTGYTQVKIFSKQRAGGTNGGPKNFKLQYKVGNSSPWADIPRGAVTLGNNWTTGVIMNLELPNDCQNQSDPIYIRWIMTTNNDVNGGNVTAAGVAKIDEILVTGTIYTGIDPVKKEQVLSTFPNPSSSFFSITLKNESSAIEIYNNKGQLVYYTLSGDKLITVKKPLPSGMYFIKAIAKGKTSFAKHIVR